MSDKTPAQKWEALVQRGSPTVEEIDAIDRDTPGSEHEPEWWIEMMAIRAKLSPPHPLSEETEPG